MKKVGYQGCPGAYSALAAERYFGSSSDFVLIGYETFAQLLDALKHENCDCAILPVENSTTGHIQDYSNKLYQSVGEVVFRIEHCLLALPGASISQITRVYSHPQALAQCRQYLSLHHWSDVSYSDTAKAAERVAHDRDPTQAAIASKEAGNLHGLHVIDYDIADKDNNQTRFVILERRKTS